MAPIGWPLRTSGTAMAARWPAAFDATVAPSHAR